MEVTKYPSIVEEAILRLTIELRDFMRSSTEDDTHLPTIDECREAAEETYADKIIEYYDGGKLSSVQDIDDFIYAVFNMKDNYTSVLKFSTKATILHTRACLRNLI